MAVRVVRPRSKFRLAVEMKKITKPRCRRALDRLFASIGLRSVWEGALSRAVMSTRVLEDARSCSSDTRLTQIVGTPRSGSTLLSTIVDTHPKALCLAEPFLAWLKKGEFEYNWDEINLPLSRPGHGRPHKLISRLCQEGDWDVVAFKETFRTPWHPTFPTREFLKENSDRHAVDQSIVIMRDPRDTWSSVIRRHPRFEENTRVLCELVYAWNELYSWIEKSEIPYVRYEDVVSSRSGVQNALNKFGLDMREECLFPSGGSGYGDDRAQKGGQISDSSIGRYQEDLHECTERFIEAQCYKGMKILEYN